jgi:hypothetical protein
MIPSVHSNMTDDELLAMLDNKLLNWKQMVGNKAHGSTYRDLKSALTFLSEGYKANGQWSELSSHDEKVFIDQQQARRLCTFLKLIPTD